MSHWFHRNPLKASAVAKFELKKVISKDVPQKICGELRTRRDNLLHHLCSASNDPALVESVFVEYLSLFYGFVYEVPEPSPSNNNSSKQNNSKLRYLERFVWSNSLLSTNETIDSADAWFEVLNLCVNFALWCMKRAAWISSKDEVRESDAKQIHSALRKAAGVFIFVKENTGFIYKFSFLFIR